MPKTHTHPARRRRRTADTARQEILDAAERLLIAGGPDAVRVQAVARDVGITDAAVHYHFANREGLMEALLKHAGRRLKQEVADAAAKWDADSLDVRELIRLLSDTYAARGYSRLALWLAMAGWRPTGGGMFGDLAKEVHAVREARAAKTKTPAPKFNDTLQALALLQIVQCAEPLFGNEMRRSVGLRGDAVAATNFRAWLAELLEAHLGDMREA